MIRNTSPLSVAVLGASGLLGATVVDRLLADPQFSVRPLIHSTGRAWRLARLGVDLSTADVMDPGSLQKRLQGCQYVVNCSRGPQPVMLRGLSNLLSACAATGVRRLVHISSVSSYGDLPPGSRIEEGHRAGPLHSGYARIKAAQDNLVARAVKRGLDCISLCPPMITGPFSGFLLELMQAMRTGKFGLVDGGSYPCPTADVGNVAYAVERALLCDRPIAGPIFVLDDRAPSWAEVAEYLQPLLEHQPSIANLSLREAESRCESSRSKRLSVRAMLKHLGSSKVRSVMREDALLATFERGARWTAGIMPKALLARLHDTSEKQPRQNARTHNLKLDDTILWRQLRRLEFSPTKARETLGYSPLHSVDASMVAFQRWYQTHAGAGGVNWDLLSGLFRFAGNAKVDAG